MNVPGSELVRRLVETYGNSFFLFHPHRLKRNWREFEAAFNRHYPRVRLAYSFKTNYMPAICDRVLHWGGLAEVVSSVELAVARRLGFDGQRIIFNGPGKTISELETAFDCGTTVNADSASEIENIIHIARSHKGRAHRIGIRCAFEIDGTSTRFGIDDTSDDLARTARQLRKYPNIVLAGLHCHIMPPGRSTRAYREMTQRMIDISDQIFDDAPPAFINMGGGFYSRMTDELRESFGGDVPDFNDYGTAIAKAVSDRWTGDNGPLLILEPGLAIVADTMQFATSVLDIRTILGRAIAQTSGSVYDIRPTKSPRNLPLQRIESKPGNHKVHSGPMDIVGYTCMEDDVMHRNYQGDLAIGDTLLFDNVGAYTNVLKPPFIRGAAPILEVNENLDVMAVARRREDVDDLLAAYTVSPGVSSKPQTKAPA